MLAVLKQTGALRLGFALRAGLGFLVVAAFAGAAFFIRFGIVHVAQPARFGFWTALGGGFVFLLGASSAVWFARRSHRIAVFLAASAGFLIGLWWALVTYFPAGLFPGMLGVPVGIIWSLSAALSFAYAAALVPRVQTQQPVGHGLALAMLALAWIVFVKGGLNNVGEPVDFARMVAPRRMHTPLGIAALDRGSCVDPAPPAKTVALESATALTSLGQFTDISARATRTNAIGHSVRLWRAGPQVIGVVSTWLGRGPGRHAFVENVQLDANGNVSFDAFYADGFYDHFEGTLKRRRLSGLLTTADVLCVRRVLAQNSLSLRSSKLPPRLEFSSLQPTTLAQFQTAFNSVHTRP